MNSNFSEDKRIVLTLDAGGTNFVFSAIQGNKEIVTPIHHPANPHDLDKCLNTILQGFEEVSSKLSDDADAISFAFPGPADYQKGIIGNLPNFKAFTDGVALGPMLEDRFGLPVFINNDGSLYAYGEALSGFLPNLNKKIIEEGGIKQFKNLIGLTLGTGFGCGIVLNNLLLTGDNSNDAGIHATLNKYNPDWNAEESVSTRAIQRVYTEKSNQAFSSEFMPVDIANIANGMKDGNKEAAIEAFRQFGEGIGSSISNLLTLIDGIVVIGGGITASWNLFAPAMFKEINRKQKTHLGEEFDRLPCKVYNLMDQTTFSEFAKGKIKELDIPFSDRKIKYDEIQRVGIGISQIGASTAIALGAYAFALQQLDK
jgi:glucokinase